MRNTPKTKQKNAKDEQTSMAVRRITKEVFDEAEKLEGVGSKVKYLDRLARQEAQKLNIPVEETEDGYVRLVS